METKKENIEQKIKSSGTYFLERLGEESWTYIKTVVDIVREPILILDKDLRVMAANDPFCQTFQVELKDTEGVVVYELGNGQWNIPNLRKLLEEIIPKNTFFKGFEVIHDFPMIGKKIMILNARQIFCKEDVLLEECPPIILLAIEDITEIMSVAEILARHTNQFESEIGKRTDKLEAIIKKLQKEITKSKK